MQHHISQPGKALQAFAVVEISDDRYRTQRPEFPGLRRIPDQGKDLISSNEKGDGATRDVTAADDEQSFHAVIMR